MALNPRTPSPPHLPPLATAAATIAAAAPAASMGGLVAAIINLVSTSATGFVLPVKVNGIDLEAKIDTGADRSIISPEVADSLKSIKRSPADVKLTGAFHKGTVTATERCELTLNMTGRVDEQPVSLHLNAVFYIVPCYLGIVLGNDVLGATQPTLHLYDPSPHFKAFVNMGKRIKLAYIPLLDKGMRQAESKSALLSSCYTNQSLYI
ncbi:hypothetical protein SAMD00019534_009040 [Acytostelium subglobosum LB1]|uniref:hypothetical protein n=1 Tax=Acytostelium subglobosum LB1 TaxID=1410327 RepID=UPI000644B85D|nr:hypothetical protein SAMD00019534_009040 [Acytostelium subglobosum LB1]GAM17729.1 hypothetical protein SAMD00019534_009040 [Acytostelium subglobosum LB1]|eukprot:XP_012758325.1 hypothetical protein SAMD00019534_009040 [Acytostelium subglobosum LB1]